MIGGVARADRRDGQAGGVRASNVARLRSVRSQWRYPLPPGTRGAWSLARTSSLATAGRRPGLRVVRGAWCRAGVRCVDQRAPRQQPAHRGAVGLARRLDLGPAGTAVSPESTG